MVFFSRRLALPRRRTYAGAPRRGLRALGTSSKWQQGSQKRVHLGVGRRCFGASATTAVSEEEGIGCPRRRERTKKEARPLLFGLSWPFYPCARVERIEAAACSKGGGERSEHKAAERVEARKAFFPFAAVFFPSASMAAREQDRNRDSTNLFLSLALSTINANNRSVWTLPERRPSSTSSSSGKGERGERRRKGKKELRFLWTPLSGRSRLLFF